MFTGIVEERGDVREMRGHRLVVGCSVVPADSGIGASVAVNGVCLTVVANDGATLAFDLSEETLARTSLRRLGEGDPVNLERPVSLAARLGGHIVQGHVDGVGEVAAVEPDGAGGVRLRIGVPGELLRYAVEKGSITVDGVSLTVAALHDDGVTIALIPHTLEMTTLGAARPGDPVNLEVDVIAKYVERLMEGYGR
jgi:riboflavin synthase